MNVNTITTHPDPRIRAGSASANGHTSTSRAARRAPPLAERSVRQLGLASSPSGPQPPYRWACSRGWSRRYWPIS
jgi:hypothetical protein